MAEKADAAEQAFERYKIRLGVRMTVLYSLVYAGFVALSVFRPELMGVRAVLGLNLAIAYGLGLIVIAIIFAVIYNRLCAPRKGSE
ncbi:MAG: DUF485 domain-containing protein [Spirochaetaceae bacterium]|nr:MAG: DUF485 domain-containing protein [Spirochaetaceae bacterium]